jgi:sterol desaturase/sphingolipid hydroxylase (fatty acid hydroxylase superfamily)
MVVGVVLTVGILMVVWETQFPGRRFEPVRGWWSRAVTLTLLQAGVVFGSGSAWDGWMLTQRPWSAEGLGLLGGALVGYLAITFVYYWWHRARHHSHFLWRVFHQIHHSPSRIEIITSFYKHPLEVVANGLLSSAILYLGVGLSLEAATLAVLISALAELFYHWNVKTPYWLGFLFQRPESHCVHHERGRHTDNFGDLPLWDMLFGTFNNPKQFDSLCGFSEAAEQHLGRMLVFGKVTK